MSDYFDGSRVLVPVDLSREDWEDLEPVELLSSTDVLLLGFYPVKDQVSLAQAREQLGEKAQRRLEILNDKFFDLGIEPESELVFSENFSDAVDRVAVEKNCSAILTWNQRMVFEKIGVLLKCKHSIDHVISATVWLMIDQQQEIVFVHFLEEGIDDETREKRKSVLKSNLDYLCDRGFDRDQLKIRMVVVDDPEEAMVKTANEYDVLIMGETEPTVKSTIFGLHHELVQEESDGPVLIVRNPEEN